MKNTFSAINAKNIALPPCMKSNQFLDTVYFWLFGIKNQWVDDK